MSTLQIILLCLGLIAAIVFMYVLLPKLSQSNRDAGKWARLIIFMTIIGFLSYDFYLKQKYFFLIVMGLGTFAFVIALFRNDRKK
jgi:hypothetical protein